MLLVGLWAATTVVAVVAGVLAVSTVGATIRDRGPVGDEVAVEWRAFLVECRDTWAYGVGVRRAGDDGLRIVSWEKGPDDDVDAVFSDGRNSVDLEVFCNRGRPTLAELERNTLGDED